MKSSANAMDPASSPPPIYESLTNFALFGLLWAIRPNFVGLGFVRIYLVIAGFCVLGSNSSVLRAPDRFLGLRDAQLIALGNAAAYYAADIFELQRPGIFLKPAESVESV